MAETRLIRNDQMGRGGGWSELVTHGKHIRNDYNEFFVNDLMIGGNKLILLNNSLSGSPFA